ncbi:tetratricopeptide repeat-containing protein [uncultured Enterovirga sp.]|uniref:tetratricopeptide repeat-containing protein n=1 Tax=uncultured Enterovirga sp. TaxID=2026352 RepID=UPI0035CC3C2F
MVDAATIEAIDRDLRRAELIGAYDKAKACLDAGDDHPRLRYLSVLALARAGATAKAATQYRALRLNRAGDVDGASLWARIRKDAALSADPARRPRLLARAARSYFQVYRRTQDAFPGINAATLSVLSGDLAAGCEIATSLLSGPALQDAPNYYAAATRAEALVILGRWDEAAAALCHARERAGEDYGALSTTRCQLAILLPALRVEADRARDLLAILAPPVVAHFSADDIDPDDEHDLAGKVEASLREAGVGFGIGTLWTTGALVMAEQVLTRGAELHLVLPLSEADYLSYFGNRSPPEEVARRRSCLAQAATVTSATSDGDFPDPDLVAYAALIARGLARTRARRLSTECLAIEVRRESADGTDAAGRPEAGRVVPIGQARVHPPRLPAPLDPMPPTREMRAFLFADVYRFSSIPESSLPGFWCEFMAGIGEVMDGFAPQILYRNTWGDAFFLVVAEIEAAAELALAIQEKAAGMRRARRFAPELRIGLHHGPVFRGWDPIRGVTSYFGTQVSRAARVEPIAPPGAVYVTEPFAAILATTEARCFEAEYVGRMPLPKKYGEHRMYRLARRWRDAPGTAPVTA